MTVTGYPDFQQFNSTSTPNLFPAPVITLPPGNTVYPIDPVAGWGSITMDVAAMSGGGSARIDHFADPAGAVSCGFDQWSVTTNTGLLVRSPLRGQFMQLSLFNSGTTPAVFDARASMQSTTADRLTFPVSYQAVAMNGVSVAPSGQAHGYLGRVVAGRGFLFAKAGDGSGKLGVQVLTENSLGVLQELLFENDALGVVMQPLEIPDRITRVSVFNNDAAVAHSLYLSLIVPPQ